MYPPLDVSALRSEVARGFCDEILESQTSQFHGMLNFRDYNFFVDGDPQHKIHLCYRRKFMSV